MKEKTEDSIALITGGSQGIGYAIAHKLSADNIKIVVADVKEVKDKKDNVWYKLCDVSDPVQVHNLYKWIISNVGTPDILILNAGQGIHEKLTEGDPEKWQKVINVNLMGALRCIRAFVPDMLKKKKGHVFFISSVSANQPHPYGGVYSASKSALEVIAETLRLETLPYINVTVLSPGITETNFFSNQISGNQTIEKIGMGAIQPEEIAEDVMYILNKKQNTSINKIITRPISQ